MTKFWRLQNLAELQLEPSWNNHNYPEYEADDGSVFGPRRLLAAYPASEWLERAQRGEFDEEMEG